MRLGNSGIAEREWVAIGKVLRVHGVHGEVKVQSLSDVPSRFETLTSVVLTDPAGHSRTLAVRACRRLAGDYLIGFEGIDTPEAAASLVGGLLRIPEERLSPLPDGRYYECDLLGMAVRAEDGAPIGTLTAVLPTGANAVFVVEQPDGREHLIPGTHEVVRAVDVPGRLMTIRPMPGLLDERAV